MDLEGLIDRCGGCAGLVLYKFDHMHIVTSMQYGLYAATTKLTIV